jgi:hypothetical protein
MYRNKKYWYQKHNKINQHAIANFSLEQVSLLRRHDYHLLIFSQRSIQTTTMLPTVSTKQSPSHRIKKVYTEKI